MDLIRAIVPKPYRKLPLPDLALLVVLAGWSSMVQAAVAEKEAEAQRLRERARH